MNENIVFSSDEERFVGTLYKPKDKRSFPVVIVLHGAMYGERSDKLYDHLKDILPRNGYGVFLYDRRGTGESSGNFQLASFEDLAKDTLSAVEVLKLREDIDQIGFYGISQGGWVASLAASKTKIVDFLLLVSTPAVSPAKQMLYAASMSLKEAGYTQEIIEKALSLKQAEDDYYRGLKNRFQVESWLKAEMNYEWYPYAFLPDNGDLPEDVMLEKWFYQIDYEPLTCFSNIYCPILFLFADNDVYVSVEESIEKFRSVANEKGMFVTIRNTDHLMNDINGNHKQLSKEYLNVLTNWIYNTSNKIR